MTNLSRLNVSNKFQTGPSMKMLMERKIPKDMYSE